MELRIRHHAVVDSTNEAALRAIAAGDARHGDVHVATRQTRGRGRLGRTWESAYGEGLYLTLVLLPPSALSPAALTMATGLAVLRTVRELGVGAATLKWPNDVLVGGAKLAGILVESRGLDPNAPHYAVGVGLNVLQEEFPPELEHERPVTSLRRESVETTPEAVREALLAALGRELPRATDELGALERDYLDELACAEGNVLVQAGPRTLTGRLASLTVAEGVALRTEDGDVVHVALEHVTALLPL